MLDGDVSIGQQGEGDALHENGGNRGLAKQPAKSRSLRGEYEIATRHRPSLGVERAVDFRRQYDAGLGEPLTRQAPYAMPIDDLKKALPIDRRLRGGADGV